MSSGIAGSRFGSAERARSWAWAAAASLALGLVACGGSATSDDGSRGSGCGAGEGCSAAGGAGADPCAEGAAACNAGGVGSSDALPQELTLATFDADLQGAFDTYHFERAERLPSAVPEGLDADVLCLTGVFETNLREELRKRAGYLFEATPATDERSKPTSELDRRNPPAGPACPADDGGPSDPSSAELLDRALQCVEENCSMERDGRRIAINGDSGRLSNCLAASCSPQLLTLVTQPGHQACWSATFAKLSSFSSLDEIQSALTTDAGARFAFDGSAGSMLLSRRKLENVESFVLPSSEYRRVVTRAEVALGSSVPLDVYCVDLTIPVDSTLRPYVGAYGGDPRTEDAAAWQNELGLQLQRLSEWVEERSLGRRAVVLGSFNTHSGGGGLDPLQPELAGLLEQAFAPAIPVGQSPLCTWCPDNPLLQYPDFRGSQPSSIRLHGIPRVDVLQQAQVLDQPLLEVDLAGAQTSVPLSSRSGLQVRLRLPGASN